MEHALDPQTIAKSFSSIACTYDRWARPHSRMAQKLLSLLPDSADTILELGCGTGILTELLCAKYPAAHITAIDIAPKMVEQCKKRCRHKNLSVELAVAEEFTAKHATDLIVSSNSFHWFYDKQAVARNIRCSLAPGGRFALAISVKGFFQELYTIYESITGGPPIHLWDELECEKIFTALKLPMEKTTFESFQMEEIDPWNVLRSIKGTGTAPKGLSRPLSPREVKELVRAYNCRYKSQNGVSVTYNTFYGITEAL